MERGTKVTVVKQKGLKYRISPFPKSSVGNNMVARLYSFVLLLLLSNPGLSARAAITVGSWTAIYKGVEYTTGSADAAEPVLQQVKALRINLLHQDISFLTTPSNGGASEETNARKASTFLSTHGVQVAINANFYNPGALFQSDGQPKDLEGLAISQGNLVSPQETDPVANRGQVLLLTQSNEASFANTINNPISLTGVYNAVAGDARVLLHGNAGVAPGGERHPRTAVGVSQDGRYLTMITIDGRQPGFSEGATLFELSEWLIRFGAYEGVALDGGGSTTMVRSDGQGGATVLNSPIGAGAFGNSSGERYNGNHLGVFAADGSLPPIGDIAVEQGASDLDLTWSTEPGYNYVLLEKSSLQDEAWSTNAISLAAESNITVTVSADQSNAFYRVTSE